MIYILEITEVVVEQIVDFQTSRIILNVLTSVYKDFCTKPASNIGLRVNPVTR